VVDELIKITRCVGKRGCITQNTKCKTHHLWRGLEQNIYNYLSSISIEQYIKNNEGTNFL
jgi:DNA-binding IscR family transcriptional regulator